MGHGKSALDILTMQNAGNMGKGVMPKMNSGKGGGMDKPNYMKGSMGKSSKASTSYKQGKPSIVKGKM